MRTALNRIKRRHKLYRIFIVGSLAHHSNSIMMASFIRQKCRTAILFLLIASAVGSPSGPSLRSEYLARREKETSRAEEMKTPAKVPANPVESSTKTVTKTETPSMVYSATTTQPSSENPFQEKIDLPQFKNEDQQQLNITHSEVSTSSPPTVSTPKYEQHQHDVSTREPGNMRNTSKETLHSNSNRKTSTPIPNLIDGETQESIESEKEEDETFNVEDLLTPVIRSATILVRLMSLSMQNLDTTFRGNLRNPSPVVQYADSFRTTLLQISQKLSNAFLVASINSDKMKMHILFVPSKVKEATGYLEKLENSTRMTEFLYLPLKNLKETTDQTFNLSIEISSQFGDLVQLVDEVIESHSSSKSNKEKQVMKITSELHQANQEKRRMEHEINSIENEIYDLKEQKQSDENAFYYALEDLKHLQDKKRDESQCYWKYNWDLHATYSWICPNHPSPFQIQQLNRTAKTTRIKLENTMKLLTSKEEEAAKKREVDNELLITIERLSYEMNQLNQDVQLLGNTSVPLSHLRKNYKKLDKNWNKFVTICKTGQSNTAKSLDFIEEVNRTSTNWSSQLSEKIALYLEKTKEDLFLAKTVIDSYLEGSSEYLAEIIAEVEQMMTKSENTRELERRLIEKCDMVSRDIKNITEKNQERKRTQPSLQNQKGTRWENSRESRRPL